MRVGFKTGPNNWDVGRKIVTEDGADLAEIWFDVTNIEKYREPLAWFLDNDVDLGLHYWGNAKGELKTNLATHHDDIRQEIIEQIKKTIDFAAENKCVYVNAHPGAEHIERMDFDIQAQSIAKEYQPTPRAKMLKIQAESASELNDYALKNNVLFTIETLPAREASNYRDKEDIYDPKSIGLPELEKVLADTDTWLANDITHTSGGYALDVQNDDELWQRIMEFSERNVDRTKLIHVNTVMTPHDGADSHHGVTEEDFSAEGIFPSKQQLKQWLGLYKNRDDVFVIPEPAKNMQENYQALVDLVQGL